MTKGPSEGAAMGAVVFEAVAMVVAVVLEMILGCGGVPMTRICVSDIEKRLSNLRRFSRLRESTNGSLQ
jgi:hypothetical protein